MQGTLACRLRNCACLLRCCLRQEPGIASVAKEQFGKKPRTRKTLNPASGISNILDGSSLQFGLKWCFLRCLSIEVGRIESSKSVESWHSCSALLHAAELTLASPNVPVAALRRCTGS